MELFFQKYPDTNPVSGDSFSQDDDAMPVVIVPGLFGSTSNWRSFAKKLAECCPVYVVDQRNHGRSPHANSNSYADMANDLLEFLDFHELECVNLCGHSMGGKVAMMFSLLYPSRINRLIVLDIAPVEYQHTHAPFLEKMMSLDLATLESRAAADKFLGEAIPDTSTRLFLLQSLVGSKGQFNWRLNLQVLLSDMPKISGFPSSELDGLSNNGETLFISGELSDYVKDSHHDRILKYFPSAGFSSIPNAGHWLHAEQPLALMVVLLQFLHIGKKNDRFK